MKDPFYDALSELELLTHTQVETESRADWLTSLARLQDEEATLSRFLDLSGRLDGSSKTVVSPEVASRIDALIASYAERIARIEMHKEQNREELASLGSTRELAVSALSLYSQAR